MGSRFNVSSEEAIDHKIFTGILCAGEATSAHTSLYTNTTTKPYSIYLDQLTQNDATHYQLGKVITQDKIELFTVNSCEYPLFANQTKNNYKNILVLVGSYIAMINNIVPQLQT